MADQIAEAAAHQQRTGQRQDEDGQHPGGVGRPDSERGGESGNDRDDGRETELDQRLADADGDDGGAGNIHGADGDACGRGGHPEQCTLRSAAHVDHTEDAMAAQVTVYSNVG